MAKFKVIIREARWHTITFECEADSIEEIDEHLWSFVEEAEAGGELSRDEGDVLSDHGDTKIEKV